MLLYISEHNHACHSFFLNFNYAILRFLFFKFSLEIILVFVSYVPFENNFSRYHLSGFNVFVLPSLIVAASVIISLNASNVEVAANQAASPSVG